MTAAFLLAACLILAVVSATAVLAWQRRGGSHPLRRGVTALVHTAGQHGSSVRGVVVRRTSGGVVLTAAVLLTEGANGAAVETALDGDVLVDRPFAFVQIVAPRQVAPGVRAVASGPQSPSTLPGRSVLT